MRLLVALTLGLGFASGGLKAFDKPVQSELAETPKVAAPPSDTLELPEILRRWKASFVHGRRSGSLAFRRHTARVHNFERVALCQFDWDEYGNWQISSKPWPATSGNRALVPGDRLERWIDDRSEVWCLAKQAVTIVYPEHGTFEAIPGPQTQPGDPVPLPNWKWICESIHRRIAMMPELLIGPGWPGSRGDWESSWDWSILQQNSQKIILRASPQPSRSQYRDLNEVRWIIDRPSWTTSGVRTVERSTIEVVSWYRSEDFEPAAEVQLLTTDRLEAGGFLNASICSQARGSGLPRPADALIPRNRLLP